MISRQISIDSITGHNYGSLVLTNPNAKVMRNMRTNKRKQFHYTYSLNSTPLEWVDTFRYLGVRINTKLTWTDHVLEVRMKATCVLNLLRRAMQGCSKQAKARAYIALVRPHLETCSPVWTPYQKGAQDDLEKVQKCAARWICVWSGTRSITAGLKLMRSAVLI